MLEILCRRAAAEYRDRHSDLLAPIETPVRERYRAPELRDVAVPGQVDLLVGSMSAFGPLTPSALCDETGSTLLYLFSGPGVEANPLARLAWGLYHALTIDGPPDGLWPLRSIALRQGRQRIVIQPVAGEPGRSRLLVAAGAKAGHPGLAHLQVGRAAERLGSL